MADSPPNLRYPEYYMGPQTSQLTAGAGNKEAGGSRMQQNKPVLSMEEQMMQMLEQIALLRQEVNDLLPRYPDFDPNYPEEGSMGIAADGLPFQQVKLILVNKLEPFKRDTNDLERFFGDCIMYFEAHLHSFQNLPSLMIPFTASFFTSEAKNWWVHQ
ncbi:hypothetical protein ARMGADRAFT_1071376 [Armillaria gallica]|uniref:Uncharacterized protein n=1 Tax=Armillaria gallica TaxID=47427 RepID=A0A2H3E6A6_ARMGA|nr:hypothetical protein ARMGADRAFT_1071376 [Armillaria gallica]